jgi:leucyl-tRNA synthetase
VNSAGPEVSLDGLSTPEAKERIIAWLEKEGLGARRVNYRLRDWLFSRQRYWGEPFPIVFDEHGEHHGVRDEALPVTLPELADYAPEESPDPRPLLAKARDWVTTTAHDAGVDEEFVPPKEEVTRETNTMPGSAGSSWYFLRYCDPRNATRFVGEEAERYWMNGGVDFYIGGAEHAVGHLLYARFWHKVLFDLGLVSSPEPFKKLFHQGMITAFAYQRADKSLVAADEVDVASEQVASRTGKMYVERSTGAPLDVIVAKMSKSLKNVVNPDDVIAEFGADTFRLYEMYMGPLDASKPWNPRDIAGCFRFLARAWRVLVDEHTGALRLAGGADPAIEKALHRALHKVGHDIERLAFNTAIAAMIELVNTLTSSAGNQGSGALTREQAERFALMLAPFCPHMSEELWHKLGHQTEIALEAWPHADERLLVDDEVEVPVQILGKVRHRLMLPAAAQPAEIEAKVLADAKVQELIAGKPVKRVIVVPGKLVNIVTG